MTHLKDREGKRSPHPKIIISHAEPHIVAGIRFCAQFLNPDIEVVHISDPSIEPPDYGGHLSAAMSRKELLNKSPERVRPQHAVDRYGAPPIPQLTARQYQVLENLMEGKTNKEIARTLGISPATVRIHVSAVMRTLGVTTRAAAAVIAADELRQWRS
ncbi:MAG: response regulator transcription factor [Paracoccus sp. (in: a-proteobacteria)]